MATQRDSTLNKGSSTGQDDSYRCRYTMPLVHHGEVMITAQPKGASRLSCLPSRKYYLSPYPFVARFPYRRLSMPTISFSPYSGISRKLVVAIDVGTTFSGVSYTILDPGVAPQIYNVNRCVSSIHTCPWSAKDYQIPWTNYRRLQGPVGALIQ